MKTKSVEPNIADLANSWLKSYGLDYKLEQETLNSEIDKALNDYFQKAEEKEEIGLTQNCFYRTRNLTTGLSLSNTRVIKTNLKNLMQPETLTIQKATENLIIKILNPSQSTELFTMRMHCSITRATRMLLQSA